MLQKFFPGIPWGYGQAAAHTLPHPALPKAPDLCYNIIFIRINCYAIHPRGICRAIPFYSIRVL